MSPWFKKPRREDAPAQKPSRGRLDPLLCKNLEDTIVGAAIGSRTLLEDQIRRAHSTDQQSWASYNFLVRAEIMAFFLHMLSRHSFSFGGPSARAVLQDAVVGNTVRELVRGTWNTSQVREGFDAEEWLSRQDAMVLEIVNEAETDYSSCTKLVGEGAGTLLDETTFLGKLASRVSQQINTELDLDLRLLVFSYVGKMLADLKLQRANQERMRKAGELVREMSP